MSKGVKIEYSKSSKESPKKRNLRSKDRNGGSSGRTQFDFDNINRLIYQNQQIVVKKGTDFDDLYQKYEYGQSKMPEGLSRPLNLVQTEALLPRKSKHIKDPLADGLYDNFHKRMRKEERVMLAADKIKMLTEVDNLHTSLQLLQQYDWVRHLPAITRINNMKDYAELERKRELTIKEIKRLLEKYDSWRKRQDALASEVKDHVEDLPRDYDEYNTPIEELRKLVRGSMRKNNGAVIKLNLNNGYALVIDPVLRPKIVSVSHKAQSVSSQNSVKDRSNENCIKRQQEGHQNGSKVLLNKHKMIAVSFDSHKKIGNKIKPLNINDVKRSTFDLTFDETNDIALGQKVPQINDFTDFQINMGWRRKAEEWKSSRKSLRGTIRQPN